MKKQILPVLSLFLLSLSMVPVAFAESPGWRRTKNAADDIIYAGKDRTLYCGCVYTSDGDNDGSGSVEVFYGRGIVQYKRRCKIFAGATTDR